MFENDALQNITEEEVSAVLDCLKPMFPLSIHAYYFINSLVKLKKKITDVDIGILCPEGGHKSGAVFFYLIGYNHMIFSVYCWTKEGENALKNALLETKRFQWKDHKYILVSCMNEKIWSIIEPLVPQILKYSSRPIINQYKVYWLPADEVIKFDVNIPECMYIGELKQEHAEMINSVWPHRTEGSEKYIEMSMKGNFARGLYKPDGTLVAWAFYWFFGALGVVQTAETERRKGYGKVIAQAVSKEMASLGLDVNLNIIKGNTVSEVFFQSLGFKHAFDSYWVFCQNF